MQKLPSIAILGLNPHCETTDLIGEEEKEIIPAIKHLKEKKLKYLAHFLQILFF